MTYFLRLNGRILAGAMLLSMMLALPAAAQLRFVTGNLVERWAVFSPPGQTTTLTLSGGTTCKPPAGRTAFDVCNGQVYPFLAPSNVHPVRPTGAVQSAALSLGGDVNFPYASEWTQDTSGMLPSGIIPGVLSIWTLFEGRNAIAMPSTGKGLASGAGPGNMVFNPLAGPIASDPGHMTLSFPSGNDPGQTSTPGVFIAAPMPTYPAVPNSQLAATYTAGLRQFGGTAAILSDTPNRLTLDFGPSQYQRTNGKCRAGLPFGDCQVGFALGTTRIFTSVRRNVNLASSSVVLNQPVRWQGHLWTTGTVSVVQDIPGAGTTTFASSGTDTITTLGARHLVLVSPMVSYERDLFGALSGGFQIAKWDMLIQTPEPAAAASMAAGLGLLAALHLRARRKR
jgi:hypothetical protein